MKTLLTLITATAIYTTGYHLGYKDATQDNLETERARIEFANEMERIQASRAKRATL